MRPEPVTCHHRRLTDADLDEVIRRFNERAESVPDDPDAALDLMRDVCRAAIEKAIGAQNVGSESAMLRRDVAQLRWLIAAIFRMHPEANHAYE